jgi:alkylation response protein AidB-like acyl-CoA dehydrogenase
MVVPELPPDIAELKERVGRFVADEVFPLEEKIAAAGEIDFTAVDEVRKKARAAGFSMLNMPEEAGGAGLSMLGQVALEEESGKATNGLGFAVVDRGPAELWEILTPEQRDRWVVPILRGEYREAWAVTEPGAGSDVSAVAATAVRDGDEWVLNGEKWFVTSEGDPGFYIVLAVVDGEQTLFIVEPGTPGLELTRVPGFLHDPYLDHHPEVVLRDCRVPDENRVPAGGNEGAKEWFLVERLFIAARCCGASERATGRSSASPSGSRSPSTRGSPSSSPTPSPTSWPRGSSLTMQHTRSTPTRTARSSTERWPPPSSSPPRRPDGSSTARSRSSAAAAT